MIRLCVVKSLIIFYYKCDRWEWHGGVSKAPILESNSKGSVSKSASDILCNLGCISEGWKATWSPSNPPPCLTNEALRAQRDEVTCPGSPRSMCGKAGVGSQAPGIQFSPLPSSAYSVSLEGSLYSFAVCAHAHRCVLYACACMHIHVRVCVCSPGRFPETT